MDLPRQRPSSIHSAPVITGRTQETSRPPATLANARVWATRLSWASQIGQVAAPGHQVVVLLLAIGDEYE